MEKRIEQALTKLEKAIELSIVDLQTRKEKASAFEVLSNSRDFWGRV